MDNTSAKLLAEYVDGNSEAATQIFNRYVTRLVALAQSRLSPLLQGRVDPEDVVQSAYRSFFRRVKDQDVTLRRSGDLWRLLAAFTINKARGCVEREMAQMRDPRRQEHESALIEAIQSDPTPEEAAILIEQLASFMPVLPPRDRRILELRMRGNSVDEIVAELAHPEPQSTLPPQTISAATVRRLLRDSKRALQRVLFDD